MCKLCDDDAKYGHLSGDEDEGVTCKRCGESGLEWVNTGVRMRLVGDNGKFHECHMTNAADDFKDESGANS